MLGELARYALTDPGAATAALVVDLDRAAEASDDDLALAASSALAHPGVVVGVAGQPLAPRVRALARACATSLVATDEGDVGVAVDDPGTALAEFQERVAAAPHAATVLTQVLRIVDTVRVEEGIWAESLAFSTLLGGADFARWRAATPIRNRTSSQGAVSVARCGDVLRIVLSRPERRNALDAAARGALTDALDVALADPTLQVEVRGEGECFSSGGDLDEFGTASDRALAHVLRVQRGPALRFAGAGDRITVFVHGPCVGAGLELAAFARRVVAAPGSTFRLPEVSMGLIPGAGGTVSVTRRTGRWRAAWLMLTGATLDVDRALEWGLVDDVA